MFTIERVEAHILKENNILVVLSRLEDESSIDGFCGVKIDVLANGLPCLSGKTVYLCGDLSRVTSYDLSAADRIFIIKELSHGYDRTWQLVDIGRVPICVHGVGVYYRRFFDADGDYFDRISTEHTFQSLTESNKSGKAHRTGIYLTPVDRVGEDLHFHLLRCSTNLSGPTENFRATDRYIVDALNREAAAIFQSHAPLNHVLAQIYHNTPAIAAQKQTKAKIAPHADMAIDFCLA